MSAPDEPTDVAAEMAVRLLDEVPSFAIGLRAARLWFIGAYPDATIEQANEALAMASFAIARDQDAEALALHGKMH